MNKPGQPMDPISHEVKAVRRSFVSQRPNLTDPLNLFACTQDTTKPIAQQTKVELQACCRMYASVGDQQSKNKEITSEDQDSKNLECPCH